MNPLKVLNSIKVPPGAVLRRCQAQRILQRAAEVALIGEPCLNGDLGKRLARRRQFAAGVFEAKLPNIFANGTAVMSLERRRHINRVDPNGCCNVGQDRGPGKAFVQDVANLVQPGRSFGAARVPEPS